MNRSIVFVWSQYDGGYIFGNIFVELGGGVDDALV